MSFGPTGYRSGGTRGGADRFSWEDVKADKYRENYLGHSMAAPVGRWQKGKDLLWYTKKGNEKAGAAGLSKPNISAELEAIKKAEEDLINEALHLGPRRHRPAENTLEPAEVKELLKRGATERDRMDVERVEGLGAAPAPKLAEHIPRKSKVEEAREALARGENPFDKEKEDDAKLVSSFPQGAMLKSGARVRALSHSEADNDEKETKRKKSEKKKKKKKSSSKKDKKKARDRGSSRSPDRTRHDSRSRSSDNPRSGRRRSRSRSRSRSPVRRRGRRSERSRSLSRHRSPSPTRPEDSRRRSSSRSPRGRDRSRRRRSQDRGHRDRG